MNTGNLNTIIRAFVGLLLICTIAVGACAAERTFRWGDDDGSKLVTLIESGEYGTITSVLILHDGERVFEHYANGADETTLHNTRSVTKTITGMAVGLAIHEGFLKIDDPLAQFFADVSPFDNPDSRKLDITAEDLLTMSSPLECDDWNQFSRGNEERMYIVEDWSSFFWDLPIRGFPSWALSSKDPRVDRDFSYCTAGVQILGEVVERATKTPFTDYVEEKLFAPLGIDAFEWPRNGTGKPHLGGGLLLTTRELAKLAELQRNNGIHNGQEVLPGHWTRASAETKAIIPMDDWEYGYLWWLRPYEVDGSTYLSASMNGNGGNRVAVLADQGMTIVITKTDFNTQGMHAKTDKFFETEIIARLSAD